MSSLLQLATRKTIPVDFSLLNDQLLTTLYITSDAGGQTMRLEISNSAGEPLDLLPPGQAGQPAHHFELVFRPGVLQADSLSKVSVQDTTLTRVAPATGAAPKLTASLTPPVPNKDGTVALKLALTAAAPAGPVISLAKGDKITITLAHLVPDGRLGSRGTRVLLRYFNTQVHGASIVISGFRETHLSLVTHLGKQYIPLHVGVVGMGQVLNNGVANPPQVLRISNLSRTDTIQPSTSPPARFYVSFEAGPVTDEWALGTADQVKAISVKSQGADATAVGGNQGLSPEWQLPVPALAPGAHVDITLGNIVTSHPAGFTKVNLRYDNIPGYWDGQFVALLEKSPLVTRGSQVGVGISPTIGTLHVANPTQFPLALESPSVIGTWLRLNNSSPGGRAWNLISTGANNSEGTGKLLVKQDDGGPVRLVFDDQGRVGIGIIPSIGTLHVANPTQFPIATESSSAIGTWFRMNNTSPGGRAWNIISTGAGNGEGTGNLLFKQDDGGPVRLMLDGQGRVGVGVTAPTQALDVSGGILARANGAISNQGAHLQWNRSGFEGETWLLNQKGGGNANAGIRFGSATTANATTEYARFVDNGNLGIGLTNPVVKLDVLGTIGVRNDAAWDHLYLNHDGSTAFVTAGGADTGLSFRIGASAGGSYGDPSQNYRDVMRLMPSGNVGIGTAAPNYPLEVQRTITTNYGGYGYLNGNGSTGKSNGNSNNVGVSIRASGRIMADEFNAFSDARLKAVAGRSDCTADLALLRQLRITDYTMRDQVQYGDRAFKKIIGQELESVFPQAVHRQTGFLPDIYATASQVQRQGKELLLTLPTGLAQAATAGQRLKLVGPTSEVIATLAEAAAAGSRQLLVTGATSLADTPQEVFVFGLEHPDVRTVDYEAVAMLHVSATQALARQVQEMQQALPELLRRLESQDKQLA